MRGWLILAWLCLASSHAAAFDDDGGMFSIETANIDTIKTDGQYVTLKAAIVRRTDIQSAMPVAIIAHGRPGTREEAAAISLENFIGQAKDMAARGYLAVVLLREGFGGSGGIYQQGVPCTPAALSGLFEADADDLQSAITAVRRRADIDSTAIIIIANSAGGPAAAALAARRPNGLVDIIAVSGGLRESSSADADVPDSTCDMPGILSDLYAGYARASSVPELFVYDTRDRFFGDGFYDRIHAAFINAGGQARIAPIDDPEAGGHNLFATPAGRLDWLRQADLYLAGHYLPAVTQNDVDRMAMVVQTPEMRGLIDEYAHGPLDKALAVSASGRDYQISMGNESLARAEDAAVRNCQAQAHERCGVVFGNMMQLGPSP